MGPGQHPDACALTCTARTMTSSSLVVVPSTLTVASTPCHDQVHHTKAWNLCDAEEFLSSEIIIVNCELMIKFLFRNFLLQWPPTPTTTTSMPPFPSSRAQTFRFGNRRWGTSSSPSASGALLLVLLAAHDLWK